MMNHTEIGFVAEVGAYGSLRVIQGGYLDAYGVGPAKFFKTVKEASDYGWAYIKRSEEFTKEIYEALGKKMEKMEVRVRRAVRVDGEVFIHDGHRLYPGESNPFPFVER